MIRVDARPIGSPPRRVSQPGPNWWGARSSVPPDRFDQQPATWRCPCSSFQGERAAMSSRSSRAVSESRKWGTIPLEAEQVLRLLDRRGRLNVWNVGGGPDMRPGRPRPRTGQAQPEHSGGPGRPGSVSPNSSQEINAARRFEPAAGRPRARRSLHLGTARGEVVAGTAGVVVRRFLAWKAKPNKLKK